MTYCGLPSMPRGAGAVESIENGKGKRIDHRRNLASEG